MLKELDQYDHERSDKTFSILYDQCDVKKRKAGKRVFIEHAKKCGLAYHCADHEMRGIIDQDSGKTRAVHMRLVFEFNGKTVYW